MSGTTVSHYQIVDEIGAGGMGVVYLARDTRLGRTVALKALPSDKVRDQALRSRFLREAQTASSLNHPGIIAIYDVLCEDDVDYIVMEYVQGVPLQRWIPAGGLSAAKAVGYALQIAEAVAAAHAAGVIHRDLKPGNVMITPDERVKVLDFGLAKFDTWAGSGADASMGALTTDGALLGTLEYMAPEQALGEQVDARADIFSLGVMLFEMLSGRRPFHGKNPVSLIEQVLKSEPPSVVTFRRDLPASVDAIVTKAIAKTPDGRFATMDQFAGALRDVAAELGPVSGAVSRPPPSGVEPPSFAEPTLATVLDERPKPSRLPSKRVAGLIGAGLALVIVLVLAIPASRRVLIGWVPGAESAVSAGASPAELQVPSLGVVSLVNRTGDDELDWYGTGLAQLVRDNLSQSRHVRVVSDDTLRSLLARHDGELGSEAAVEAGIDYLLKGEILKGASGLTVAARLTDTRAGSELASERLRDLTREELIPGADRLAKTVRRELSIPPDEEVDVYAADFASSNPAAYELYVAGLKAFSEFRYEEAERQFLATLGLVPDFAMARYRLAQIYGSTSRTDEATAAIARARADAAGLPERERRYIEAYEAYVGRRYPDARDAYRKLVEEYSYETEARYFLAWVLRSLKDYEGQIEQARLLTQLDGANPSAWSQLGTAQLSVEDYNGAVVAFQEHLKLDPNSANAHLNLGDAYRALGELDLAREQYDLSLEEDPDFHFATVTLAVMDFVAGRREAAAESLRALVDDRSASARHRIDAVFELASMLRAEGRFREAAETLVDLGGLIEEERVRKQLALSVRASCWMELGDYDRAAGLVDEAIAITKENRWPTTRYLFARALLELREGRLDAVRTTAQEIADGQVPEKRDRTEEKAAAYLEARVLLAEEDAEGAIREASRALALEGYEYAIYRLALARAYLTAERHPEALVASKQAATEREPLEPRLDLELDRERARLLQAEVQLALGRPADASRQAREFLDRWSGADGGLVETERARRLAS